MPSPFLELSATAKLAGWQGLVNLFGVELWERFSYGMLTILGYYLYLSTVLGGWIADRLLGMERTVLYGGVVVMLGHIALAMVPGLAGVGVGLVTAVSPSST